MEHRLQMLVRALDFYGLREVSGKENNPVIMKFFSDIGFDWVQGDETSWCSAFINWIAWDLNLPRSGKLDARSWLNIGDDVLIPKQGHITILWREQRDSWKGHVGLFIRKENGLIWLLGGNQSNQVNISAYPEGRLLGYREI